MQNDDLLDDIPMVQVENRLNHGNVSPTINFMDYDDVASPQQKTSNWGKEQMKEEDD